MDTEVKSSEVETKETFRDKTKKLAAILFADTELQGVVRAWPEMSEQARHVCLVLAERADEDG